LARTTGESVSLDPEMSERPPSPRRITVIANPVSGSPRSHGRLPIFLDLLKGGGVEADVQRTEGPGHATELAREASRLGREAIVAVGGDGTVNEVLNGMETSETALATLPLGTSSIFARDLGIPFDPTEAAEVLLEGRRRRLDYGLVNGRRFLMVVGIGWDAHVVNAFSEARSGHGGKHRYLAPIARAVVEYDFPELTIRVDGEEPPRKASLAFACNIRNYAAFFRIAPKAVPDDGALDFVVLREGGARNYLKWAIAAFRGTLPRYREVDYVQGRTLHVTAERPVPVEIDGDPGGTTPVTLSLVPDALEVLVP
jgi:YegS/Rv2252/BmrU family lipid kinase